MSSEDECPAMGSNEMVTMQVAMDDLRELCSRRSKIRGFSFIGPTKTLDTLAILKEGDRRDRGQVDERKNTKRTKFLATILQSMVYEVISGLRWWPV